MMDAIKTALSSLVLRHPFIASIALTLEVVEDPTCETGWTDGERLGFNPSWVASLRPEQVTFFVAHEAFHVALAHHLRRGNKNEHGWNVAADYVVNENLVTASLSPFPGALLNPRFKGLSTEQVYRILADEMGSQAQNSLQGTPQAQDKPQGTPQPQSSPQGTDNGTEGANHWGRYCGEVRDATTTEGQPLAPDQRAEKERQLKTKVTQALNQSRAMGHDTPGAERVVGECVAPSIDWREALQNFVQNTRPRTDYSWTRPNSRYISQGVYLPTLGKPELGDLVVVLDTSGSVSGGLLAEFRGELESILAENPSSGFHLLFCDYRLQSAEEVTMQDAPLNLTLKGGGGTCFRPPFRWVDREGIEPAGLIYFTDLAGRFPILEPDYPILWLNYGDPQKKAPFGETVTTEYDACEAGALPRPMKVH